MPMVKCAIAYWKGPLILGIGNVKISVGRDRAAWIPTSNWLRRR